MIKPGKAVALLMGLLVLSGCTARERDYLFSFGAPHPSAPRREAVSAPAPMAQDAAPAPVQDEFCRAAAQADSRSDDLDAASQARLFGQSFRQCVAMEAAGAGR